MGRVLPIQKVKILMRHKAIRMTADLYMQLGLEDVGEEVWTLPRVLVNATQQDRDKNQRPANKKNLNGHHSLPERTQR